MYLTYKIDKAQADKIIAVKENYLNDVKAKEIKPAKLSETVSAFANAGGGDIYVGITENGESKERGWCGFQDEEDANHIVQALFDAHPFGNHISFEFLECDNYEGLVLHITVKKVKEIVKSTKGDIYVRVNAGKAKVSSESDIKRLKLDKGIVTFEDELVAVKINKIENSESIINFLINVIPFGEPLTYLNNQELISGGMCKVSGVLLFCDEPAIYLPKRCSVKLMRYKTKDEDIGREFLEGIPQTIEGDIYHLIYTAVEKTKALVEGVQKLGADGLEVISYPDETLHEIITNAILHRDYSIVADVQIRVFDNRIEVESPGKLPGHVTTKNILEAQSARNPTIVRLINKFPIPPNQDVGEGLDTAFRAMEALRLKPPVIIEKDNSVLVTIPHESLASPEEMVMEYLNNHDEVTNKVARDFTGIKSENTMKNVFLRLKERNLIEPIPERKGAASAWRKRQEQN
ncbi:putative DNA binding domain-containing protein [Vibrio fluvialis]|uniref:ATP-binding protein n=1 Tax=Vibrio fluvialis TaxID=676 RepID=UPI001C9D3B03|nr:ATP-binding protein [Vibrio fluvialis]MBY7764932.1 putative DNA binding domain-containing protein [Vibrio fluvialis]MBY7773545.1 putative DNA binding domain-containing protein [Vibrio fluvialis]MBY7777855.1 putative DNA binding domain-containing protein [Vibrio fluvialis]MBY7987155.1 putative DNA binding domain-containing protein [Vibrio fluvialis]MBY7991501.1 putative DNA binding domain-containing protein [Vibrio fluvialis]